MAVTPIPARSPEAQRPPAKPPTRALFDADLRGPPGTDYPSQKPRGAVQRARLAPPRARPVPPRCTTVLIVRAPSALRVAVPGKTTAPNGRAAPRLRRRPGSERGRCVTGNGRGGGAAASGGAGGFRVGFRVGGRGGGGGGGRALSGWGAAAGGGSGIRQTPAGGRGGGDEPVRRRSAGGASPAGAERCPSPGSSRRRRRLLSSSRSRRLRPPPRSGSGASSRAPAPTPNARRGCSSRPTGRRAPAASSARTAGSGTSSGSCWRWRR